MITTRIEILKKTLEKRNAGHGQTGSEPKHFL